MRIFRQRLRPLRPVAARPWPGRLCHRLRRRLATLILDVDVEGAEVVAVLAVSLWGLVLSLPLGTFADYPVYRQMASLAPQSVWAAGADGLALWQALALLAHSRRWRRRGLQAAAGWWMCLAVFVFRAAPNGAGWGLYGVLCGACAWAYWRIRREERQSDLAQADTTVPPADPPRLSLDGHSVDCRNVLKCLQVLSLASRLGMGETPRDGRTPRD